MMSGRELKINNLLLKLSLLTSQNQIFHWTPTGLFPSFGMMPILTSLLMMELCTCLVNVWTRMENTSQLGFKSMKLSESCMLFLSIELQIAQKFSKKFEKCLLKNSQGSKILEWELLTKTIHLRCQFQMELQSF